MENKKSKYKQKLQMCREVKVVSLFYLANLNAIFVIVLQELMELRARETSSDAPKQFKTLQVST